MPEIIDLNTGQVETVQDEQKPVSQVIDLDTGGMVQPESSQSQDEALGIINDNMDVFESLAVATGRGFADIIRGLGLSGAAGISEQESDVVKKSFADLEEKRPISQTTGRIAGQAAPFIIPGMGIGAIPSRVGQFGAAVALGATEGATISKGMGTGEVQDAAISGGLVAGAFDLAFPIIGRLSRSLIGRVFNRKPTAPVVNKLGEPSTELKSALEKEGITFDDLIARAEEQAKGNPNTSKQEARQKILAEAGINNPTKAQLTGDATDFQMQQELAKVSGPVRSTLVAQDETLKETFDRALLETGPASSSKPYNPVINFVENKSLALDSAISNAYKSAREMTNNSKVIKPVNLIAKLRTIASSDTATGGVYGAVKGFLKEKGLITGKKLQNNAYIDANTAEQLRIDINSLYSSSSDFGKRKLAELKEALDEDVMNFAGEDAFKEARKMKAEFESDLTRNKQTKFDQRNKEFLRDVLQNKYNPDTFFNDAVLAKSTRSSDLEQLKRYIEKDGSGEAVEAWNSVRADALEWIRDNSFTEVSGQYALSKAKLVKALDRVGRDKMRVMFTPEERQFFDLMKTVATIREPARGTALGQGPSAQAVKALYNSMTSNSIIADIFNSLKIKADEKTMLVMDPPKLPLTDTLRGVGVSSAGVTVTTQDKDDDKTF